MGQLMIVEAAGQLSLLQMSGNVFVWHLLEASLEKINFLQLECQLALIYPKAYSVPHPRSKLSRHQ